MTVTSLRPSRRSCRPRAPSAGAGPAPRLRRSSRACRARRRRCPAACRRRGTRRACRRRHSTRQTTSPSPLAGRDALPSDPQAVRPARLRLRLRLRHRGGCQTTTGIRRRARARRPSRRRPRARACRPRRASRPRRKERRPRSTARGGRRRGRRMACLRAPGRSAADRPAHFVQGRAPALVIPNACSRRRSSFARCRTGPHRRSRAAGARACRCRGPSCSGRRRTRTVRADRSADAAVDENSTRSDAAGSPSPATA